MQEELKDKIPPEDKEKAEAAIKETLEFLEKEGLKKVTLLDTFCLDRSLLPHSLYRVCPG